MARQLYVDMDEVVDAIDSSNDETTFYLDLQTGKVELWIDPMYSGEEPGFDPEDERFAPLPRQDSREDYEAMERFAASVDEEDVHARLSHTLGGKGAFARFRDALAGYPDLKARWFAEKRERLLAKALAWFAELGIEPQYELRPPPPVRPAGQPQAAPGKARVGLFDVLLLGAPDGKTELLDGRVLRVFTAQSPEQARKVFSRLAAELTEHHGLAWRKRLIEGRDSYEIERCHLSVAGRMVELAIDVPPAIWDMFASPGKGRPD